jgi:hypothetical protein
MRFAIDRCCGESVGTGRALRRSLYSISFPRRLPLAGVPFAGETEIKPRRVGLVEKEPQGYGRRGRLSRDGLVKLPPGASPVPLIGEGLF